MAKFTDYTQKTKPADADLLLIHDNAGAANKKTPFSGVWSWILDKLASAVISQLETTNKSIIPAINELNSKSGQCVTSKQAFLNAVKKYTDVPTTIRIPGTVLSEITNSKYSSSAKGIAVYDGTHIDFIFAHGNGSVIITGRMDRAGTLESLYHYTGTSALDN